MKTFHQPNEWS